MNEIYKILSKWDNNLSKAYQNRIWIYLKILLIELILQVYQQV